MREADPETILAAVAATYKGLTEYEDAGFVRSDLGHVRFETRFARGRSFEFSYSSNALGAELRPMARLTAGPAGLEFWTALKGAPQPKTLREAVGALTGVSLGASHGASCLLLEEIGGWLPTDLREPVLLPNRMVAGVSCFHIRGRHPSRPGEHSLLIDPGTWLMRGRIRHGDSDEYTEYETCRVK